MERKQGVCRHLVGGPTARTVMVDANPRMRNQTSCHAPRPHLVSCLQTQTMSHIHVLFTQTQTTPHIMHPDPNHTLYHAPRPKPHMVSCTQTQITSHIMHPDPHTYMYTEPRQLPDGYTYTYRVTYTCTCM